MIGRSGAYHRIDALLQVRRHEEARRMAVEALAEDPDDPGLLGLLTRAYLGLDDDPAAYRTALRLVHAAPDDEWGHRLASIALSAMASYVPALRAADAAVRLGPDNWQTHLRYAQAASDVVGHLPAARQAAERAVQLAPNEPSTHVVLGTVAHEQREFALARQAYERALALDPEHPDARHNLTLLGGALRYRRAARGFVATLRSDPGHEIARHNLDGVASVVVLLVLAVQAVGFFVTMLLLQDQPGPIEDARPTAATWLVALAALAVGAGIAAHFWTGLPPGVRQFLRGRLRRVPTILSMLLVVPIFFVAPVVVAVVPGTAVLGLVVLRPLGIGVVIALVRTVLSRGRG